MSRISRNIQIIFRAEKLIARRQMATAGRKAGFIGVAALMGGTALVFLNIAGYLALAASMAPALAALIVAGVNLVLAGLLVALAGNQNAESEIAAVSEVRDMAMADLEGEMQEATDEARDLVRNVRKIARDPFSAFGLNMLLPLIGLLLENLRRKSAEKGKQEPPSDP